jgi:hypothetical protein
MAILLDAETPLAAWAPDPNGELVITETGTPLSQMPQTGINDVIPMLSSVFLLSAILVSVLATTVRKMGKKEEIEE